MEHIIKNYISLTPFLKVWETGKIQSKDSSSEADLVIIEMAYISEENLVDLESTLKNKPVLILTDHKDLEDENLPNNIIILPKNLSHKEFVNGIGCLIDKIEKSISRKDLS